MQNKALHCEIFSLVIHSLHLIIRQFNYLKIDFQNSGNFVIDLVSMFILKSYHTKL